MPFIRPCPIIEDDSTNDEEEAIWLFPGFTPDPYWDLNMGEQMSQ